MKKLVGNIISVYLKNEKIPLEGLLVDIDETEVYIQRTDKTNQVYVIPKDNVSYCVTDNLPSSSRLLLSNSANVKWQQSTAVPDLKTPEEAGIMTYVDDDLVAILPVPPTFNLNAWHGGIYTALMSSHDVRVALLNKVQKNVEYFAPDASGKAKVYIKTELVPQAPETESNNTFSMINSGNAATTFLSPSEMVNRLSKSKTSGGNQNGR